MAFRVVTGPETVQGSPQWLAWRQNGIGASEAPMVMGRSKFMTPYGLYRLKRGLDQPAPPNQWMLRGIKMEPKARKAYEQHTGNIMVPVVLEREDKPHIRASLDGISPFDKLVLEIKCPGEEAHALALAGVVPPWYMDQLQHQMYVAETDMAHYWSYDGDNGVLIKVRRDDKRITEIVSEIDRFWEKVCVGKWAKDDWIAAATNWRIINAELEAIKDRERIAREALISMIADGEKRKEGAGVILTRVEKKGTINYEEAFKALGIDPLQLEPYRGQSSDVFQIRESVKEDDINFETACMPKFVDPGTQKQSNLADFSIEF